MVMIVQPYLYAHISIFIQTKQKHFFFIFEQVFFVCIFFGQFLFESCIAFFLKRIRLPVEKTFRLDDTQRIHPVFVDCCTCVTERRTGNVTLLWYFREIVDQSYQGNGQGVD